ncbi:MAG: hypothetical protein HGA45_17345 [Chloroflexales bacterium]|nr:hypothetical protein [Chloroflexales bacterium]
MNLHRPHRYHGHRPRRRRPVTYDPPFPVTQPLERYRLHHGMGLAAFADFLGIPERLYVQLVVDDRMLPIVIKHQVARRLRVPPWLIVECIPPPSAEEQARVAASMEESREEGYFEVDPVTGQAIGEEVFLDEEEVPAGQPTPAEHLRLALALHQLLGVHRNSADSDYLALRAALEHRIREHLNIGPNEVFDSEAWARDLIDTIGVVRGVFRSRPDSG